MATWGELEKAGTKWRDLEEMTWGELEEFCVINPKTKQIPDDMEVSFVPMQSVSDTGAVQTDEVRKASEVKKGFTFFEEGDVLFAKITPCMENGKGGIARGLKNGVGFGSTEFHVLHPAPEKVSSEWLYYLTSWDEFRKQCARNMTGSAGQKRVPKSYLEHYKVHLPSLEEQRRIAAVLDKVSGLIAKRREQLDKLDELVKARFVEMFGDPVSNPKRWRIDNAEKHIDLISGFPFDSSQYTANGINICGGLIIMPQRINWSECKHWGSIDGYEDYALKENDIVIALDRPWISEGFKIALVDSEHLPALLIQRTARIRAIDIYQLYLLYCFILGRFDKHCNVTGSLVPHISAKDIRSFPIMLPPLELQAQFVACVEKSNKSKLTIQQSLDKLEVLKKSLMQQYFG